MRRNRVQYALVCVAMLMLLCACAPQEPTAPEETYTVYYPAAAMEPVAGGDAVVACQVVIAGGSEMTRQQLAEALVCALLDPPDGENVASPLPAGAQLSSLTLSARRARVDFSGGYGSLSRIGLTLADCCLALTLTQLDGVDAVLITEQGRQLPYHAQAVTAADALLGSLENPLRTFTAYLWYAERDTLTLCAERQTMLLREGETRLDVLLETLLLGPELETHVSLFPEGFRYLSARAEEGVCYLNLPADVPLPESEVAQRMMLEALVRTLCSLDSVDAVQVVLDGESAALLGALDISVPLVPQEAEAQVQSVESSEDSVS